VHDFAADESEYEWPKCVAGDHRLWAEELDRWACRPCEGVTARRLRELNALFPRLNKTAALMRGARRTGPATSGSKEAPIPVRLEVLNLVANGGVATRLEAIEDAWQQARGRNPNAPAGVPLKAVPLHIEYLAINLQWACENYEEIGQDMEEIRHLHAECTAALSPDPKPGRVRIGLCPVVLDSGPCGAQLTATVASPKVRCPGCRTEWPDMGAWRELRRAQEVVQTNRTGVAA
jgi:hypothetical protein